MRNSSRDFLEKSSIESYKNFSRDSSRNSTVYSSRDYSRFFFLEIAHETYPLISKNKSGMEFLDITEETRKELFFLRNPEFMDESVGISRKIVEGILYRIF